MRGRFYTDSEDKIILDNYVPGQSGSAVRCQRLLDNRSIPSIQERAQRLFFGRHARLNGRRWFWTDHQNAMFFRYAGILPVEQLCKRLRKSKNAVEMKARQQGVSLAYRGDYLTASEVAEILDVSDEWVTGRINKGLINYEYTHRLKQPFRISYAALKRYFRTYPTELDDIVRQGKKPDMIVLVDILAGVLVNGNNKSESQEQKRIKSNPQSA